MCLCCPADMLVGDLFLPCCKLVICMCKVYIYLPIMIGMLLYKIILTNECTCTVHVYYIIYQIEISLM